jgi:branched-subunit amino acid transport protein AzlD
MNRGVRLRHRLNSLSTALLANVLNLLIILILKGILDVGFKSNGHYNMGYGVVQLAVIVTFWLYITYAAFKSSSDVDDNQVFGKYLLYSLLPMLIMTVLTTIIMIKGHTGIRFIKSWNAFTFVVSPTLYLFLPFGVLSVWFGSRVPAIAFFYICIGIIAAAQIVGYAIGSQSRKVSEAKDRKRKALEDKYMLEQQEKAQTGESEAPAEPEMPKEKPARKPKPRRADASDPLGDVDSPAVIETEAFSPITDEMVEKVLREERRKNREEREQQRKKKPPVKGPKWVSTDQKDINRKHKK